MISTQNEKKKKENIFYEYRIPVKIETFQFIGTCGLHEHLPSVPIVIASLNKL